MGSLIDYDEYECDRCGHIGVLPDGGFDYICPECDYEGSMLDENGDSSDVFEDLDEIEDF